MGTQGSFGYKIGRKIRLMHVQFDADMLWQILVREIYVLMKHYGSIDSLREAFENLLEAKGKPKKEAIEKCKVFTSVDDTSEWYCLTRHCQYSFINILESGYFLNNGHQNSSLVFILDFNTNSVRFYGVDWNKKETEYEKATIDEIMEFEEMPTKTYIEIVSEMRERFENYDKQVKEVDLEIERINNIIKKARELGGDENVLTKAKKLLEDMEFEKRKLEMKYRVFYHRLDALNLIDHEAK
jgi:hypothetical protein